MTLLLLFSTAGSATLGVVTADFVYGAGIKRAEFVYLGLEDTDNDVQPAKVEGLAKYRIASATSTGVQGRTRVMLGLASGVLNVWELSAWTSYSLNTDAHLSNNAAYYWAFTFQQKEYFGDGISQIVYDPRLNTLVEWESGGSGAMPEKCALAAVYRGRVVLARPADNPTLWYMSAMDDAGNWDFYPATPSADQAVFGSLTTATKTPDIINTLIPFKDDYMLFGCDKSIWILRGDPAGGGEFDRITDTIGMAFGAPWCKDPTGILYFFGSKGGVYRMIGDSQPQHLSDALDGQDVSIQARLRDVDFGSFRIELVWDFERQGLIVLQIPFAEDAAATPLSWFWDVKNNAWCEDQPGSTVLQPYAVWTADGDQAADRRVLYGCYDGFIRELDSAALDDDGVAIDSYVTIGPIAAGGDSEIVLNRLRAILASEHSGCDFAVYSSDDPAQKGSVVKSGRFGPGMNPRLSVNRRGAFMWVRLRNPFAAQRWALEELQADVVKAGMRRVRA